MQEVYEFIGNIPLIDLETETINISIPWIDQSELNRFQVDWEYALDQWSGELEEAKEAWSYGLACNEETPAKQARCEQENGIKQKAVLQAE